jgi:hypothetical protein
MAAMTGLAVVSLLLAVAFMVEQYRLPGQVEPYVVAGAGSAFSAAFFFFLQGSHLLWLRGQIALAAVRKRSDSFTLDDWLTYANGWGTWVSYRAGWIALVLTAIYCVVNLIKPTGWPAQASLWLPLAVAGVASYVQWQVYTKFSDLNRPFQEWFDVLRSVAKLAWNLPSR